MFVRTLIKFISTLLGAFFFWAKKDFKGKFDDEMTSQHDTSVKSLRNYIIGFLILIIIIYLISSLKKH